MFNYRVVFHYPIKFFYLMDVVSALSAVGSLAGGMMNKSAIDSTNAMNLKISRENNAFNAKEALKNRIATSPIEQARQNKAAGINPAAQGSVPISQGSAQATSAGLPTQLANTALGDSIMNMSRNAAEIANIQSNTRKTNEELDGVKETNKILRSDAKFRDAWNQGAIQLQSSTTQLNIANTDTLDAKRPHELTLLRNQSAQVLQSIDNMKEDLKLCTQKIAESKANEKLYNERIGEVKQNIKESISRCLLNKAYEKKAYQDIEHIKKMMEKLDVEIVDDGIKIASDGINLDVLGVAADFQKSQLELMKGFLYSDKAMEYVLSLLQGVRDGVGSVAMWNMAKGGTIKPVVGFGSR